MSGWAVTASHGDAAAFHAAEPIARRSATFFAADRPTLVLGSAQPDTDVDHEVANALGVEVVRRRSGGGAVLLLPGEFVWLDLVIPSGDALWLDDVGKAMVWVGDLWQRTLAELGVVSTVHHGGLVTTDWSRSVCFAGVGTGEVIAGGAKLVGISQRRTRGYARFQSMCHLRWRPEWVAALISQPAPTAAALAGRARAVAVDAESVMAALVSRLP